MPSSFCLAVFFEFVTYHRTFLKIASNLWRVWSGVNSGNHSWVDVTALSLFKVCRGIGVLFCVSQGRGGLRSASPGLLGYLGCRGAKYRRVSAMSRFLKVR